jgi:hypothetical protein
LLDGAGRDRHQLVYWDEAHIHQDVDLGHSWGERGKRFFVASSSPGLSAKLSFSGKPLSLTYGLYFYNKGQVRIWPDPRTNAWVRGLGAHALDPWDTSVSYRRRIPGVCLCRSGGLSGVGHGDYLFRC